jgi:hypothetical protein
MWVNFKVNFAIAHQDLRDSQVTTNQADYHNANAVFEVQQAIATAIANLAMATAADHSTVASLMAMNSNLAIKLAQSTAKLASAQARPH